MTTHPRLYLIRHGETDWNAEGRLLSFTDRPLSVRGEEQAVGLASTLAGVRWDRAVSSPLVRARKTAELVLASRADAPALGIDDRLREMDFGPYEGWSEAQLAADPIAVTRRRDGAQLPGVEPEEAVAERARSLLSSLDSTSGTTLVVGHGRMLRILIATALGLPPSFSRSLRMRNCRPAVMEPGSRPLLLALERGRPRVRGPGFVLRLASVSSRSRSPPGRPGPSPRAARVSRAESCWTRRAPPAESCWTRRGRLRARAPARAGGSRRGPCARGALLNQTRLSRRGLGETGTLEARRLRLADDPCLVASSREPRAEPVD